MNKAEELFYEYARTTKNCYPAVWIEYTPPDSIYISCFPHLVRRGLRRRSKSYLAAQLLVSKCKLLGIEVKGWPE